MSEYVATIASSELEQARRHPFSSEVLGEEKITCLECGARLQVLGVHLGQRHGMTGEAYKARWGYCHNQPLASLRFVQQKRAAMAGRGFPGKCLDRRAGTQGRVRRQDQERRQLRRPAQSLERRRFSVQQVVELYRMGHTPIQIAASLGCSLSTVQRRLDEVGLADRQPRRNMRVTRQAILALRSLGLTWREVGWKLRCSPWHAWRVLKRTGGDAALPSDAQPDPGEGDIASVVRMRLEGMSIEAIAARLGASRESVTLVLAGDVPWRRTRRIRIAPEALAAAFEGGLTLPQMAHQFGCSTTSIARRLRKAGLMPPVRKVPRAVPMEAVVEAYQAGLTVQQVAEQLGCSASAVSARLRRAREQGFDI